jgi:hypothetical protein
MYMREVLIRANAHYHGATAHKVQVPQAPLMREILVGYGYMVMDPNVDYFR